MAGMDAARMVQGAKASGTGKTAAKPNASSGSKNTEFAELVKRQTSKQPEDSKDAAAAERGELKNGADKVDKADKADKRKDADHAEGGNDTAVNEAVAQLEAAIGELMGMQGQETLLLQETRPDGNLAEQLESDAVTAVSVEDAQIPEAAVSVGEVPTEEILSKEVLSEEIPAETQEPAVKTQAAEMRQRVPEKKPADVSSVSEEEFRNEPDAVQSGDSAQTAVWAQEDGQDAGRTGTQETAGFRKNSKQEDGGFQTSGSEAHAALAAERPTASVQAEFSMQNRQTGAADPVKTTPETLPQDIGMALAAKLPSKDGTLTIELEPVSLGKLTIKVAYDGEKAAVSILASNPKTMELLSQKAGEIGKILEERTGQETAVYTPEPAKQQPDWNQNGQNAGRERQRDEQESRRRSQSSESFVQQLRLGLI